MEYIKSKLSSPPTAEELASRTYVRCDTPGVEVIPPNEAEDIQAVADMVNTMQRAQFNKGCHCFGGTHARTQGVVKGKFIVLDDLPNHLKQSELFEQAKVYDIACRYSSEPGDPGLDVCRLQFAWLWRLETNKMPGSDPGTTRVCHEDIRCQW